MTDLIPAALFLLGVGIWTLRRSRDLTIKRWLLPAMTAGIAAGLAIAFATTSGGNFTAYAVGLPLGMSVGLLAYHLFDYCRRCGSTRSWRAALSTMRSQAETRECAGCRAHRHLVR